MNGSSPASVGAAQLGVGPGARGPVDHEVRHVVADPASLVGIPPDVALAFAPRFAVRVGRRAVVEHPPVGGPRPAPLRLAGRRTAVGHPAGGLVDGVGVHAGVDPAAGGGRAVGAQLGVGRQRVRGLADPVSVDLGQHRLPVRVAVLVGGVVPGQIQQRPVPLVGRAGQPLPDPLAEFVEELQFALALSRRLDGLVPPLHQSLCLREGSGLLHVRGGGQEEHLGLDLLGFQFPGGDFGPVLPPGGRFDQVEVAHHQPLEMRHAQPLHPAVRRTDRGVLAEQEVALDLVGQHAHHGLVGAVRAGQSGQVVVGPVVVRGGRLPHHALSRLTV